MRSIRVWMDAVQIRIGLEGSAELGGFPNLAEAVEGHEISINVREEALEGCGAKEGEAFKGEVRKAFGRENFLR